MPKYKMVDGVTYQLTPEEEIEADQREAEAILETLNYSKKVLKSEIMLVFQNKIRTAMDAYDERDLILALVSAPQAVKDRIGRVRTRIATKFTEIDSMDLATVEDFDIETGIDWS